MRDCQNAPRQTGPSGSVFPPGGEPTSGRSCRQPIPASPPATAYAPKPRSVSPPRLASRAALLLTTCALCFAAGCTTFGERNNDQLRDDIVAIRQYPSTYPWMTDPDGRIVGFRARVYFLSAKTERGAFVPGTINAELHVLQPLPDGTYQRDIVHKWSFSAAEARPLRIRSTAVMGDSYGLLLRWPPELDLANKEIQIIYEYVSPDGQKLRRGGSRFRVPTPGAGTPRFHTETRIVEPKSRQPQQPAEQPQQPDRPASEPDREQS